MAGFLYYFPQAAPVSTVEQVPDVELRTLLRETSVSAAQNNGGPDGKVGQMISVHPSRGVAGGEEAATGYWPDRQTWTKVKEAGPPIKDEKGKITGYEDGPTLYWIGREKASPPTPLDVQREKLIYGHPVKLADGKEWTIPVVGPYQTRLPRTFAPAPGKRLTMVVREQYAAIFTESEKWHALARTPNAEYDWHDAFSYAVGLLGVNYRVGFWEVLALGLIDTDNFWRIASASFGTPDLAKSLVAVQKKTEAANGSEVLLGGTA